MLCYLSDRCILVKNKNLKIFKLILSYGKLFITFITTEIIKEIKNNGDNLNELLRVQVDYLEPFCLEKALIAAVKAGNHINVGKLVVKGATNIDYALKKSIELRKHDVRAMLLLVIAAKENDKDLVLKLFGAPTHRCQNVSFVLVFNDKK